MQLLKMVHKCFLHFSVGTDEFTKTRTRAFCLVFVLENLGTIVNAVVLSFSLSKYIYIYIYIYIYTQLTLLTMYVAVLLY